MNQVGYPTDAPKVAFAMLPAKVTTVRFEVVTPYGVVYRGTSADDVGSWNSGYQAVYQLSFTGAHRHWTNLLFRGWSLIGADGFAKRHCPSPSNGSICPLLHLQNLGAFSLPEHDSLCAYAQKLSELDPRCSQT